MVKYFEDIAEYVFYHSKSQFLAEVNFSTQYLVFISNKTNLLLFQSLICYLAIIFLNALLIIGEDANKF